MVDQPQVLAPVTVIAGAASSVGRATAARLAADGHELVLLDINLSGLVELREELDQAGQRPLCIDLDLSDEVQVAAARRKVAAQHRRVSGLVNTAGAYMSAKPIHGTDLTQWELVVGTNLTAAFLVLKHFFPLLQAGGSASVVNIASNAARSTATSLGPEYTAAKAGVLGLTRHAARDWAPHGIRVNAIAPGPIAGPRLADLEGADGLNRIIEQIPLARLGAPADTAGAIAFLLSDDASFITGATLDVNGGIFMG